VGKSAEADAVSLDAIEGADFLDEFSLFSPAHLVVVSEQVL
jgi:hypothetical protein